MQKSSTWPRLRRSESLHDDVAEPYVLETGECESLLLTQPPLGGTPRTPYPPYPFCVLHTCRLRLANQDIAFHASRCRCSALTPLRTTRGCPAFAAWSASVVHLVAAMTTGLQRPRAMNAPLPSHRAPETLIMARSSAGQCQPSILSARSVVRCWSSERGACVLRAANGRAQWSNT